MRRKANFSLLLLALLFVIALVCTYVYPEPWWPTLLLYVAEAGLVGALADLFAITALFRHPLGLKILPHTAIIPKNRDKLVDGVVTMVEEQLLSKPILKEKVQQYHLVDLAVTLVERGGNQKLLAEQIWGLVLTLAKQANVPGLADKLDQQLRGSLQAADLSPYAGRGLRWLLEHTHFQTLITQLVDLAAARLSNGETKQLIHDMLNKEKDQMLNTGGTFSKWLKKSLFEIAESSNAFNLDDAAGVLYDDLQRFMAELRDPEHELRKLTTEMLYKLASELETREELSDTLNSWKNELLDKISLLPSITALLTHFRDKLLAEPVISETETSERAILEQAISETETSEWANSEPKASDTVVPKEVALEEEMPDETELEEAVLEEEVPEPGMPDLDKEPVGESDKEFDGEETSLKETPLTADKIKAFITRFVLGYWDWFKEDREIKDWLEGYAQQFVQNMIETEHALVGQIVRTTLNDFTEKRLTEFIESKVDTDLQRIRLNGALVGAALGAAFYLLLNGVYRPLLDWFGV